MSALAEFWSARLQGERRLLVAGAALVALTALYLYVWLPVSTERTRLLVELPQLRAHAAGLERDAAELQRLRAKSAARFAELETLLKDAFAMDGSQGNPTQVRRMPEGRVEVTVESGDPAAWLTGVARVHAGQGLRPETLQIEMLQSGGVRAAATYGGGGEKSRR